jgi:hypothetical protein
MSYHLSFLNNAPFLKGGLKKFNQLFHEKVQAFFQFYPYTQHLYFIIFFLARSRMGKTEQAFFYPFYPCI